jgi:hypothetical protein
MATLTASIPQFKIVFNILTNTLKFEDLIKTTYASYSGTFAGIIEIQHIASSTTIYQNAGWSETDPDFTSPDIESGTWYVDNIDMYEDPMGEYLFRYWVTDGTNEFLIERVYTLDYTSPEVSIQMTVLNSTSQLISEDLTEYDQDFEGVTVTPTITRDHTVTKPAGSGANAPGTVRDYGSAPSRTIGGGATDATRLWTRIWQTNIETFLAYTVIPTFGEEDTEPPVVVIWDTVYGDDNIFADNDTTLNELATCYSNMITKWIASLTSNFDYRENYRDKIIQANALWAKLQWYERVGENTDATIEELKTLLSYVSDTCPARTDTKSEVIVPWAAITGTGSSGSDFSFTVSATAPIDDDGADGDLWLYTTNWYLYQKVSGAWVSKGCIKGEAGAAAAVADQLYRVNASNQWTDGVTPASTTATALKTDTIIADLFNMQGDFAEYEYSVLLAHNDNGKTVDVRYNGSIVLSYFTDELIDDHNDRILVKLRVYYFTSAIQHLEAYMIAGGNPGIIYGPVTMMDQAVDISSAKLIQLYGTNSVSSAADIRCDSSLVTIHKQELTGLPDNDPESATGRGLVSQSITAEEGQTEFNVTDFICNQYALAFIDGNLQGAEVVARDGNKFTTPPLTAGQVVTIVN